ncbi:CDP-alcohol phosphatidyltransferase family protein [Salinispora arenicola]|uniref:CDP-alcohol phosphatidyltransferase family protein n=1 Tax=Salinispora arenicola TaxID=168697 RepID=UPI00037E5EEA|nr:CDP-alcohol phosphatidyltransferase family protein [Salinispora arenicola]
MVATVRSGPLIGLSIQIALLVGLAEAVGLGPAGWLAGLAYGLVVCLVLSRGLHQAATDLGPADRVTLTRAVLVGAVTALVADGLTGRPVPVELLTALTTVALSLDAVDGYVARRTGTASTLGARFDMEVDSVLVAVLSLHVAPMVGHWVLILGAMRYAYLAAGWVLPWLRGPLPPRYWRKVVAAALGVVLLVVTSRLLPTAVGGVLALAVLVLQLESFGRDVVWRWQRRAARPVTTPVERPGPEPLAGWRRKARWVSAALAVLLVLAALAVPRQPGHLVPAALLRIPLEGLALAAVLLALPPRARRPVAALAGALLGLLVVVKVADLGFGSTLGRPFDVALDWRLLDETFAFLRASVGRAGAVAAAVAAGLLAAALLAVTTWAVLRLNRLLTGYPDGSRRVLAGLVALWLAAAATGVRLVPGVPVADAATTALVGAHARQVQERLRDRSTFADTVNVDPYRFAPDDRLLTALRGKDVLVAFVESYGRDAVREPEFADIGEVLDEGQRRLSAAGFGTRSAFLTSPTTGGGSWLAHATLLSGLWVDNDQRHRTLLASDRTTLGDAFQRAGWRTVGVMPAVNQPWPEGAFYGYEQFYDEYSLGYRGPRFSFASMPDQYTLSVLHQQELAGTDRRPVMAELALISSHSPWTHIPKLVGWDALGDGRVFHDTTTRSTSEQPRAGYRRSIEYTLDTLISYVQRYGDDELVLIMVGDHQPAPVVTGPDASRDVPIHLVARDRAVLERISGWGWPDGLRPASDAPVWRMDEFRDRFLATFSPTLAPPPPVTGPPR